MENFQDLRCFLNLELKKDHTTKMTILVIYTVSGTDGFIHF